MIVTSSETLVCGCNDIAGPDPLAAPDHEYEYSDGGNTVELYCDDRVAELEPLSPEMKLKRGATTSFTLVTLLESSPSPFAAVRV